MKTLTIYPDKWRTFKEEKPPVDEPVMLKLTNGNIVIAEYGDNGKCSAGWWAVTPTGKDEWFRSGSHAYMATNASWQPCTLFLD